MPAGLPTRCELLDELDAYIDRAERPGDALDHAVARLGEFQPDPRPALTAIAGGRDDA